MRNNSERAVVDLDELENSSCLEPRRSSDLPGDQKPGSRVDANKNKNPCRISISVCTVVEITEM